MGGRQMRSSSAFSLIAAAFALTACGIAAPLDLADDHPASPKGAAGLVGAPTALDDYKTGDDFTARAAADAEAPAGGHMQHQGMQHGGMAMPPGGGAR